MAADESKRSNMNGAYYGPPVPPRNTYRSIGRRSSSCCCCCCGPCCLLCNLVKLLLSIVVTLGVVALVLWLVLRPNEIKAHVDQAFLAQFNYNSTTSAGAATNLLQYDLILTMSIRNPNRRIGIYYDYVEARASYDRARFGFEELPPFYQGHKSTAALYPAFRGSQALGGEVTAATYASEKGGGYYSVDVEVRAKLRLKVWIFKLHYNRPRIDCELRLPVPGSSGSFEGTNCVVHYF